MAPPLQKTLPDGAGLNFLQRKLPQPSAPPGIQGVEVAWIDTAVSFNDEITAAAAAGSAGAGGKAHGQIYIIVKKADADILPLFPVAVPFVEDGAQKTPVIGGAQGLAESAALLLQGIETGDELNVPHTLIFQSPVDLDRTFGNIAGDDAEDIDVDAAAV